MNFVYILQSQKNGKYYIGSTGNLDRRLLEHNAGKTKSLRHIRPLKLVFKEQTANIIEARRIEMALKKLKSRAIIEQIIADQQIKFLGH